MTDPVLRDINKYEEQVDKEERHSEWVEEVTSDLMDVLYEFTPTIAWFSKFIKVVNNLVREIREMVNL